MKKAPFNMRIMPTTKGFVKTDLHTTSQEKIIQFDSPPPSRVCLSLDCLIISIKLVIVIACSTALIIQGKKCLERYLEFQTSAILSVKPTGEATFPAFTICPAFEDGYKEDILRKYGTERGAYREGDYRVKASLNPNRKSHHAIFDEVTYTLKEILRKLELTTSSQKHTNVNIHFEDLDPEDEHFVGVWKTRNDALFGKCYSLELDPRLTSFRITQIIFESYINIYVFIHYPGQFFDFNSKTKMYGVTGETLFIDLTYEVTINTLGQEDTSLKCDSAMDRTFDSCLMRQVNQRLLDTEGCTLPYLPPMEDNPEVCDPENIAKTNATFAKFDFLTGNGQKELCQRPCSVIEVFSGLPFISKTKEAGIAYMKLYLKSTTKVKRMVLDYQPISMFAEIGGYTGLLLGVSFMNITSLLDRVFARCRRNA